MSSQAIEHFFVFAFIKLFLKFFQRKMNDVVVVQLFGLDEVAKAQPETM